MWYIYAMEYYSAIKNNEIMSFATTWMSLVIIILSVVSQAEKDKYDTAYMQNLIQRYKRTHFQNRNRLTDLGTNTVIRGQDKAEG